MLQILLAVVGMTMAGALGFALIEQSNAQTAMAVSREDNRRLDLVAEMLERNLVTAPNMTVAMAPRGVDATWNELPASLNVIKTNTQGVPFQYCPLAPLDQRSEAPTGTLAGTVKVAGGTTYSTATVDGGGLAWENAIYQPSVRAVNPVAIITSAQKGSPTPPPCNEVRLVGGRAVVDNGLARIVTVSAAGVSSKQAAAAHVTYYVSQSGSGNGTGSDSANTAALDAVWKAIYKTRPATASIWLTGPVTTGANFITYANSPLLSNTDIHLYSQQHQMTISGGAPWYIYGSVTLRDANIVGGFLFVSLHANLTMLGTTRFYQTSSDAPFRIEVGGRMSVRHAQVFADPQTFPNGGMFVNNGILELNESAIVMAERAGNIPHHYVVTYSEGYTNMRGSVIGRTALFGSTRAQYPVYVIGNGRLEADTATTVLRGVNGVCFNAWNGQAFLWSHNQPGLTSGVRNESEFPVPTSADNQQTWATYSANRASRARARELNIGTGFTCTEN